MKLSIKTIPQFKHQCPEGMSYSVCEFKKNVLAIWISYQRTFDYNLGKPIQCIWGYYSLKNEKFYAPINAKTTGKEVEFSNTTPWTAMQIKKSPLQEFFV
jgi:hypothetical protein